MPRADESVADLSGADLAVADPEQAWREALRAGLVGLSRDPLNCETPPELLGAGVTPTSRFFRRNHFPIPELDAAAWRLQIDGLVRHRLNLQLAELKEFGAVSQLAVLECAGNGRNLFSPLALGEQWGLGAVGNARWTGVRLADVLEHAGIQRGAVEVVFRGADRGSMDDSPEVIAFERSLTVADARYSGALLAFAMNDEPLPPRHGYPVRLVVPGKYAVASVKWLTGITVTDRPFDGFFQARHYVHEWRRGGSVVREPVAAPRVRALITEPATADVLPHGIFTVRGVAWSGAAPVTRVMVSVDGDQWQPARLEAPGRPGGLRGDPDGHSWQRWELLVRPIHPGELTIRARATDGAGRIQPVQPEWDRRGYGGNFIHEVTVRLR
jgi:DMSO/TMAO reductase YedYZ molybdopterin-dependent catalytic subunit